MTVHWNARGRTSTHFVLCFCVRYEPIQRPIGDDADGAGGRGGRFGRSVGGVAAETGRHVGSGRRIAALRAQIRQRTRQPARHPVRLGIGPETLQVRVSFIGRRALIGPLIERLWVTWLWTDGPDHVTGGVRFDRNEWSGPEKKIPAEGFDVEVTWRWPLPLPDGSRGTWPLIRKMKWMKMRRAFDCFRWGTEVAPTGWTDASRDVSRVGLNHRRESVEWAVFCFLTNEICSNCSWRCWNKNEK